MFFILSKILSFFLSPIWWITVLMLLYFILKKLKRRKILLISSFVILVIFSNQFLFYNIIGWWEGPLQKETELPNCDGLILLGGFSSYQDVSSRIVFNASADRLLQAMDLYKSGKVKYFIFTGGSALILKKEKKEGDFLKEYLENIGIRDGKLLIESQSRNTHENAKFTHELLKEKQLLDSRFVLVTSAFHMKRAMGCFKNEGINVLPYKTNPLQVTQKPDFADCITPSAYVLSSWELLIREWVGLLAYEIKGYI